MKKFIIFSILFFGLIQFITIDTQAVIPSDPKNEIKAPKNVKEILKRSCYDCHSNNAVIPWYGNIAPFSWYVRSHINDGRKVLNFSTFSTLGYEKQKEAFADIEESVVIRMPLSTYLWMHSDAALSNDDKKVIKEWTKELK
jgi:hypothetical protein